SRGGRATRGAGGADRIPGGGMLRVELRRRGAALPALHAGRDRLGGAPLGRERRMRVALVHDWLTGMRGGERVLERIAAMYPGVPIHTLVWNRGSVSAA